MRMMVSDRDARQTDLKLQQSSACHQMFVVMWEDFRAAMAQAPPTTAMRDCLLVLPKAASFRYRVAARQGI